MTRGGGTRSKADAGAWRMRWWAACGALALIVAIAVVALGLPEFSQSPATPSIAPAQGSEVSAAPERGATLNAPASEAVETASVQGVRETAHVTPHASKLAPLYGALVKVESGAAAAPVTILHLGDSHIASDRITGEVRRLLQARFGDAGRGLMMPGFPFPYYKAPGFSFEKTGKWTAADSLNEDGAYGITGVSLAGSGADAVLKLPARPGRSRHRRCLCWLAPAGATR